MKLGRESAYAIEGLLALATKPFGTTMLLRDIAASRRVPQSFLAKIFQKLVRSGLVLSSRGAIRGYALARQPKEIKAREIILAIEGSDVFDRCIFWEPTVRGLRSLSDAFPMEAVEEGDHGSIDGTNDAGRPSEKKGSMKPGWPGSRKIYFGSLKVLRQLSHNHPLYQKSKSSDFR